MFLAPESGPAVAPLDLVRTGQTLTSVGLVQPNEKAMVPPLYSSILPKVLAHGFSHPIANGTRKSWSMEAFYVQLQSLSKVNQVLAAEI